MRRLVHALITLFSVLLWVTACGNSTAKKEAEESLAETRKKIQRFESQLSPGDTDGLDLVEICREKIVLASRRLVEGEPDQAAAILDEINFNVDRYLGNVKGAEKIKTFEPFGSVRFGADAGELEILDKKTQLSKVKKIRVAGRSGLRIHLFKTTQVFLNPQTNLNVTAYDKDAKRFHCLLESGELILNKKKGKGVIEIEMNDHKFVMNEEAQAEFRYMPLVNEVYVAVFHGSVRWQGNGSSGSLFKYDGLHWRKPDATLIQIPTTPSIDEPTHESKVGIDLATGEATVPFRWRSNIFVQYFQLQISDTPQFVTRIYDNQRIQRPQTDVNLEKGTYFWRVRSISKDGVPGAFTKTMELHVGVYESQEQQPKTAKSKDVPGPKLSKLDYNLIGMTVIVSGRTKPGIRINVNGVAAVQNEDGSFQAIVNFDSSGEQVVRIMAMDPTTGGETVRDKKFMVAN